MLYIDLDNFKRVNDTLGHSAGDEMLMQCAAAPARVVQSQAAAGAPQPGVGDLGRLGGDEFVVVMPEADSREAAAAMAERIIASCASRSASASTRSS